MLSYVSRHRREWQELERLVERARRSTAGMSPEDLARLDVLYRRTTVHLAQVGTRTHDLALVRYLNGLAAAAHRVIYLPPRRMMPKRLAAFFTAGFPRSVARSLNYHFVAASLMVFGGLFAYYAVRRDPTAAYALLPRGEIRQPGMTSDQLSSILTHGRDFGGGLKFVFSSFLFQNNVKVGLLALATGALAAIPTIILMVYNGMILGALTSVYHGAGIYAGYWAWLLPHGVTELWAIVLCGGAGFALGHAVVSPGLLTRAEAMRRAGLETARICIGVASMLLFAAIVESYLRQSHLPAWSRFLFAGATLVFWTAYFARGVLLERLGGTGVGSTPGGEGAEAAGAKP